MEAEAGIIDEPNQDPDQEQEQDENENNNKQKKKKRQTYKLVLPEETVEKMSAEQFQKEKTKYSPDALLMTTEMLHIYIMEIAYRSAEEAAADGKAEVKMDHFRKLLPQFLLDFA